MKLVTFGLYIACIFGFGQIAAAQTPTPSPAPTPLQQSRAAVTTDQRTGGFGNPGFIRDNMELRQRLLHIVVAPFYRKPTKKELSMLATDYDLKQKFSAFLNREDTGMFKLTVDVGCAENVNLVAASEKCLNWTMPGAGNSYSFRLNSYRLRRLADLTFSKKHFVMTGVLAHGIMVNIGDVALENINLQTNGMKFLNEFQPAVDFESAKTIDGKLIEGIERDGFLYCRGLVALENTTYVLRSIAYNGKVMRAVRGITYNELEFDKRKDITVAFRVVRSHGDGSLTILWKELSIKDSPKIKRNKDRQ